MIEYDYEIIRDEGKNRTQTFRPDKIPTQLDNLVCIEGPNSIGKSTLLHLIALSLYGSKKKKINPSLKTKMNNLLYSEHNKLKFHLKITNKDNTLEITSQKSDIEKPEIVIREVFNGKKRILTQELFERKYNLIYDIPDNPTERLKQLTDEIKEDQINYGHKLGQFREFLRNTITEILNSRDPKRLSNLKELLDVSQREDDILKKEIILFENDLKLLENSTYSKYLEYYTTLKQDTNSKIKKINDNKKKIMNKVTNKNKMNKEYRNYSTWTTNRLNDLNELFDKATLLLKSTIPKTEEHYLIIWEKIDFNQSFEELEFNINFRDIIDNFKNILNKQLEDNTEYFHEVTMYQELIRVLEQYKNLEISIHGSKTSIQEFILDLHESVRQKDKSIKLRDNINESLELLSKLEQDSDYIEKTYFSKLIELRTNNFSYHNRDSEKELIDENELIKLENDLKKYTEKVQFFNAEYSKIEKSDLDQICKLGEGELIKYSIYTETQILKEISTTKSELITKNALSRKTDFTIQNLKNEIDELEKKESHKYEKYLDNLNDLLEITNILEVKIRKDFHNYIVDIDRNKIDTNKLNEEQIKYYEALFTYLGERVDTIHHLNEVYKVEKIDVIKEIITTKEGIEIWFADMGTGQSQAAYLKGLLSTSDNRKIIALFDEVAMMDEKSLKQIYDEFKKLYKKNILFVGIVVQKAKNINVIKI